MPLMRIRYNAPAVLSFSLICVLVQLLAMFSRTFVMSYFSVGGTLYWSHPLEWFRLFSHVLGHGSWQHLTANLALILLLGPMLEEKYGSGRMLMMILGTAFVVALLNAMLFNTGLFGASSIVFMMIGLTAVVDIRGGEIPLTLVLVALIYVGGELISGFSPDGISQSAHLFGAATGLGFGYLWPRR
ncbi:MAG: rhomboid family intramembrane serine protease [Candidatus Sumerlaeaceae bacterium]